MNNFYIITNAYKDKNLKCTRYIKKFLEDKGKKCEYVITDLSVNAFEFNAEMGTSDCLIVLGGDGTLIHAARKSFGMNIPLIGVNLGNLGYLCELENDNLDEALEKLINDEYSIEDRIMLKGIVTTNEKEVFSDISFNDVVIHRGGNLRILDFIIYVDGEHLYTYSADGIIISTPTGSTGYSMSAGGPIVEPKADLLVITPINPHTLNTKSIIIGGDDEVIVEIGEGRRQRAEEAMVSFDGKESFGLISGDKIKVNKSKHVTKILKLSTISFLKTLKKKMQEYT